MTTTPRARGVHRIAVLWFHPSDLSNDSLFPALTPGFVSTRCTCGWIERMIPLNEDWLGCNIEVCPNVKAEERVADAL